MRTITASGSRYAPTQELVSKIFGYKPPRQMVEDFPLLLGPQNADHLYIRENASNVIGLAGAFLASLRIEELRMPVGAIGGVCTDPNERGQGIARELVREAEKDLIDRGAILSFLWTDQHDYYRQEGYELVGRQWLIELDLERMSSVKNSLSPAGASTQSDTQFRQGIQNFPWDSAYLLFCKHPLGLARTKADFKTLLSIPGADLWWAEKNGRLQAYAVVNKGVDLKDHIHEWAGDSLALISLVAQMVVSSGKKLTLMAPHYTEAESPWLYELDRLGCNMQAAYMGMVKMLQPEKFCEYMQAYFSGRGIETSKWNLLGSQGPWLSLLFGPDLPPAAEFKPPLSDTLLAAVANEALPLRVWWWGLDSV